jgi:HTH-type transcriptional regulator/antitoxin HigA
MKVVTETTFVPDWTVPPGSMLEGKIAEMGLTIEAMAKKIELTSAEVHQLLEGEIVLTDELADKLEELTGISHDVWNNWEQTYRDDLIRLSCSQE